MNDKKKWRDSGYALHDLYEKLAKKLKGRLPKQESLEGSRVHRLFGATLLKPELWSFKEEPLARGLALGIFVAFTPTIGIQMIIVCALVLFFPGNLPIALAVTWITNVATAAPIYFAEYKLGVWLLSLVGKSPEKILKEGEVITDISQVGSAMVLGSLVVSFILAALCYYMFHGLMALERKVRFEKYLHIRRKRPPSDKND